MKGFTCFAQKYNAVTTVKLELATPQSRSNNLPLSHCVPLTSIVIHKSEFKATYDVNNLIQYIKWKSVVFYRYLGGFITEYTVGNLALGR